MQFGTSTGMAGLMEARAEFQRAHARAWFRATLDRLLRRCSNLCTLADATAEEADRAWFGEQTRCRQNHPAGLVPGPRRLQDVELASIVGSVDRARDYTAGFLPRISKDEERWAGVRLAVDSLEGVPPVELYEYDGEYYVKDGHHRVSVMKRMGLKHVEAYVTRLLPAERAERLHRGDESAASGCQALAQDDPSTPA